MKLFCSAVLGCALVSCAQMKTFKEATVQKAGKFSNSVAGLMPGRSSIPIVKPRQGEMRDLKTGTEQAIAFEKTKKSRPWSFGGMFGGGPADFEEPLLPVTATPLDGDLLPPKVH
ncbi:MAG: hypothetical protein JWO82_2434 [Akkermansiaceae bacterium]|nr:hypothetical protein [Akkermansiaceae bacterium]